MDVTCSHVLLAPAATSAAAGGGSSGNGNGRRKRRRGRGEEWGRWLLPPTSFLAWLVGWPPLTGKHSSLSLFLVALKQIGGRKEEGEMGWLAGRGGRRQGGGTSTAHRPRKEKETWIEGEREESATGRRKEERSLAVAFKGEGERERKASGIHPLEKTFLLLSCHSLIQRTELDDIPYSTIFIFRLKFHNRRFPT